MCWNPSGMTADSSATVSTPYNSQQTTAGGSQVKTGDASTTADGRLGAGPVADTVNRPTTAQFGMFATRELPRIGAANLKNGSMPSWDFTLPPLIGNSKPIAPTGMDSQYGGKSGKG